MTLRVRVASDDPTPPYEQLRRQIAAAVDAGSLEPGARLPTVRQLASDLGIAPGTVMRAYSELEASGYLTTRRGAGTTVGSRPPRPSTPELEVLAEAFVLQARRTGASAGEIVAAVERLLEADHEDRYLRPSGPEA